jgi:hypothetical protein
MGKRIPKSEWGEGPWLTEPDHVDFEHLGYPCILHRNKHGSWCGYVGVPADHPWFGKGYDDVDAEVHGGLTYAEPCQGDVCHPGNEPRHWLGFDCTHAFDKAPEMDAALASYKLPDGGSEPCKEWFGEPVTYKDLDYVKAETERLAEQAAAAGRP